MSKALLCSFHGTRWEFHTDKALYKLAEFLCQQTSQVTLQVRLLTCYCTCRACSQPVSLQRAQPPFSRRSSLRRGPSVPRATRSEPEQQQQLPPYQQQHRSSTWASTLRTVLGAGLLLAVGILGASKQAGAATSRYWNQSGRSGVAPMSELKRIGNNGQQPAILTRAVLLQARLGPA